jgi:low molecular weight protein-tyrosine phosphatase
MNYNYSEIPGFWILEFEHWFSSIFVSMKILMVCLGNICRSPLAEGILQYKTNKAGLKWIIESAGTNGYHIGESPHSLSQKVAKENGIDISKQRSRLFRKEDFDEFDKIYAMSADVLKDIQRISKEKFDSTKASLLLYDKDVPDPWSGPEEGYHHVYELINNACSTIIENATLNKTTA